MPQYVADLAARGVITAGMAADATELLNGLTPPAYDHLSRAPCDLYLCWFRSPSWTSLVVTVHACGEVRVRSRHTDIEGVVYASAASARPTVQAWHAELAGVDEPAPHS